MADESRAWDTTTDPDNPQPLVWPRCSTCQVSWVWRHGFSLTNGMAWYWMRGCKHKGNPTLWTKDGPYEPPGSNDE